MWQIQNLIQNYKTLTNSSIYPRFTKNFRIFCKLSLKKRLHYLSRRNSHRRYQNQKKLKKFTNGNSMKVFNYQYLDCENFWSKKIKTCLRKRRGLVKCQRPNLCNKFKQVKKLIFSLKVLEKRRFWISLFAYRSFRSVSNTKKAEIVWRFLFHDFRSQSQIQAIKSKNILKRVKDLSS